MNSPAPHSPSFNPQTYWSTRFERGHDLATTGYIGMGDTFNEWLYRGFESGLKRLLKRSGLRIGRTSRVIDAGAGAGFLEEMLRHRRVEDVTGLDFVPSAVDHLRVAYPDYKFFPCDLTKPLDRDIPPADFVFCISVLYHIVTEEGLRQALSNLAQFLKPGGYLILGDNFMPEAQPYDGLPQRHWSQREFSEIFEALALKPLRYQPIFFTLNAPLRYQHTKVGTAYLHAWRRMSAKLAGAEHRAALLGPLLYAIDYVGQYLSSLGPSTHYLLLQKKG